MGKLFHRNVFTTEIPWRFRLILPFYGLRRWRLAWPLARPLLRHPLASLANGRYAWVRSRDPFEGRCLGVPSRQAFLDYLERLRRLREAGQLPERPLLYVFQAYCEKPVACACSSEPASAWHRPAAQRRFNAACGFRPGHTGPVCRQGEADCRIGRALEALGGMGETFDVRFRVMLGEDQMAALWEEMLEAQVRLGHPVPWIMDVCPLALWLARCSLFQLKTPVGVVFYFRSANRCLKFCDYLAADAGCKEAADPVTLGERGQREKADFMRAVRQAIRGDGYPELAPEPLPKAGHQDQEEN